jgi:hypothetical protein
MYPADVPGSGDPGAETSAISAVAVVGTIPDEKVAGRFTGGVDLPLA